jgi:hypothetical protein
MTTSKTKAPKQSEARLAPGPAGKLGTLVELLERPEGATIGQLAEATGWQAHSVRGAMAGALKKKHGLTITSTKEADARIYRASSGGVA